ncbi:DNA primase [Anaerosphaera aminiphila DSM 21120]|uniref:DNA primase n=1 Tax=Anaerosphaera aminiphila DSM 21120 TaxID=1120995 RepID=A0A1M5RIB9_9FIRM|nr:DNA primase [Anaerosphaera aminiphila]SHH26055.1 DNA primase [Anaerosphaera aminiphila DSM 21120]
MSYIIDEDVLNEIRDRADIVDVISSYVNLKKSGSNYMGLCPFHGEKTPSFSVSPSKGIFHCFGCGVGGDQITFIMKRENLGFRDAVKFLADKYNVILKEGGENNHLAEKKKRAYLANKKAAEFYLMNLSESREAFNYLKNRNIGVDIIKKFALGYAPDQWDKLYKYLRNMNFTDEELEGFNLTTKTKRGTYIDRFRNRIMFPIIDTQKRVIGFGGRVLDNSLPKYLNTRDTIVYNKGENLYNLNLIALESDRNSIILVEGYMDVISLYKSGISYSVASLGTSLTEAQAQLIKRYGKEVYICYDGDSAGEKATNRAIDILIDQNISPKIISLPNNLDPDDYVAKYGRLSFELEMKQSLTYLDYKISKIKESYNLDSAEGLTGFTSEVAKVLSRVKNPIERDVYIDKVSREYSVSKEAIASYIRALFKDKTKKQKNFNNFKPKVRTEKYLLNDARKKAELLLIKYSLAGEDEFNTLKQNLESYEFENLYCRIIYEELIQQYELEKFESEKILQNLKEKNLIAEDFIVELENVNIDNYNSKEVVSELINTVKKDELDIRKKQLLKEINDFENNKNVAKKEDLLKLEELISELNDINENLNLSQ